MALTNLPFRISAIETSQFAFLEASYKENSDINLSVGVPISASDEDHSIQVILNVQFKCEETPFLILEVKVQFEIEPESFQALFVAKKKKKALVIPVSLARHLATIAVGTARGVLHERLSKTKLNDLILTTIDLTKILEEDIVLDRQKE